MCRFTLIGYTNVINPPSRRSTFYIIIILAVLKSLEDHLLNLEQPTLTPAHLQTMTAECGRWRSFRQIKGWPCHFSPTPWIDLVRKHGASFQKCAAALQTGLVNRGLVSSPVSAQPQWQQMPHGCPRAFSQLVDIGKSQPGHGSPCLCHAQRGPSQQAGRQAACRPVLSSFLGGRV